MMMKIVFSLIGLLALVGGGALVMDSTQDTDGDGVADISDKCQTTQPDTITGDWGVNRYLWSEGPAFTVLLPEGSKVLSEFTLAQTRGCSCRDILNARGGSDTSGQVKMGCSKGMLQEWIGKK